MMSRDQERAAIVRDGFKLASSFADERASSRFDGEADRTLTCALSLIDSHGFADESTGSVDEGGYFARVGRWILLIDSQGFQSAIEFTDADAARQAIEDGESDAGFTPGHV